MKSGPTFLPSIWTWRNGSAPASEAGGWRFEPSRPDHCEVVELVPRLALNQEVRVRTVAPQRLTMPLRLSRTLRIEVGLMRRQGLLRIM